MVYYVFMFKFLRSNGKILDWERINALAVKFVRAFEERGEPLYITKLLKLFFYFDFISYKQGEKPFTGDYYFKLPYGPVPSVIKDQLDLLKKENDENEELQDFELQSAFAKYLEAVKDEKTKGYILKIRQDVDIPWGDFDDYFSESDAVLFADIVERFSHTNVKEVVAMTHQEIPYVRAVNMTPIGYLSANKRQFPKALPKYRTT